MTAGLSPLHGEIQLSAEVQARLLANRDFQRGVRRRAAEIRAAQKRRQAVPAFGAWLPRRWPAGRTEWDWTWPHVRLVIDALADVTAGRCDRLAIFMPPRHGKSALVTVRYVAYRVVRDPSCRVIVGAYNQTFASGFTEESRNIVRATPGQVLGVETMAEWRTSAGGGCVAAGVGSGVTGRGANLIIVDDPVKSRAEANSDAYRDRVSGWYHTDLWSRQQPGAAIILIMCMTGDTPVLMADGTERPLRDVRPGDRVATYDGGRLASSTVLNHRSNGPDLVYTLSTTCGKIVRANERHPFLRVAEDGQLKWARLRDLRPGQRIITACRKGPGRARRAAPRSARSRPGAAATVCHTTARRCGRPVIARRRQKASARTASAGSNTATGSRSPSIGRWSRSRAAGALSAGRNRATTCGRIGAASCALTTTTTPATCAACCATIATSPPATSRRQPTPSPSPTISDFTTTQIESIEPAGVEEVFDVQIAGTENFIANGLVSHNTRWHEDDLAGRILTGAEGDRWRILRLPGLAETQEERDAYALSIERPDLVGQADPLGREPGQALLPRAYDEDYYGRARGIYGHDFHAIVQQRPAPPEGSMFRRDWFGVEPKLPADQVLASVRYWDKAGTAGAGCWTAGVRLDLLPGSIVYVSDLVMGQWEATERESMIDQTAEIDGKRVVIVVEQEGGSGGKESAQATVRRLSLAGYACYADHVSSEGSKIARAEPFATLAAGGGVKLVRATWNRRYLDILASFPHGVKDPVDASSGALRYLNMAQPVEVAPNPFYQ